MFDLSTNTILLIISGLLLAGYGGWLAYEGKPLDTTNYVILGVLAVLTILFLANHFHPFIPGLKSPAKK